MKKNRKCICCNTQYTYCPDCGGADRLKESWYSEFCSSECKDLWLTATKFNMQLVTKQEAAKIISDLNLKDKSEYVSCVQRDLKNILAEEPKPKRTKTAAKEPVVKETESHEVVNKTENNK